MKEGISSRQAIFLLTICRISTILTIMPTIHIEPANQDIWIVIIVSFIYTIISSIPPLFLAEKFNKLNYIEYMEKIFGKIIGKVVGIGYMFFYLRTAVLFSYISIQLIRTSFLTNTKPIITASILIVTCTYIVSKGSIAIGRYAELFVPTILCFLTVFIFLGYSNVNFSVFLPIYKDSSFWQINYGAIKFTYLFVDLSILLMISPKLENSRQRKSIFIKAAFYSLSFILLAVIVTQGALGVEQAKHSTFPFIAYIRLIEAYSIVERVESIYILIWIFAMLVKITAYIHISNLALKEILRKKSGNLSLYAIGLVCILATVYFAEINPKSLLIENLSMGEYIYYFFHKTVIPVIAVLVYFIRRKTFESEEKLQG